MLEELVYEIVETNTDHKPDEIFDVRIIDKETVFTVLLKSKGPLRNVESVQEYQPQIHERHQLHLSELSPSESLNIEVRSIH